MLRQVAAVAVLIGVGVSPLHAQDTTFTVTTPSASVYGSPSTGGPIIGSAPRGKTFEVTRELGSWVRIPWPDAPDGVGYLHVTWGTISRGGSAADGATGGPAPILRLRPEAAPPTTAAPVAQRRASAQPPAAVPLPSHVVGVGGRMGSQAVGVAATGRAWSRGPFGIQIEAGRSTHTSEVVPGHLSTTQVASSLIYSLSNLVTDTMWVRPYVGSGAGMYRSTLSGLTPGVSSMVDNGVAYHVFGGAEFTWANLPQFALSADVRQQWAPAPFSGFNAGGVGCSLSLHWYVK